jgi:hypothetical protein
MKNKVVLKLTKHAPNETKETLDRLSHMLRLARQSKLTGFLFVAFEPGDITHTILSDGAVQNPLRALGSLRVLDNHLVSTLKNVADDEASNP